MKQLYLLLVVLTISNSLIAQQTNNNTFSKSGSNVSGWYSPDDFIRNNSTGPFTDTISLVFPDSSVVSIDKNNKVNRVSTHAWGHLYDLRHENWAAVPSNPQYPIQIFDQKDSYTWDSLKFSYIYRRNNSNTTIVDTCFVTYYKSSLPNQISSGLLIFSIGDTMLTARPKGLDKNTLAGTAYFKRDTILLTASDTTMLTVNGWGSKYRVMPVGTIITGSANAPINNPTSWFAATITYRPGHSWNADDTIESRGTQQPKNGVNYFGYLYTTINEANGGLPATLKSRLYVDNSLVLNTQSLYDKQGNYNWKGFVPGVAFKSPIYANVQAFISGISGLYCGVEELGVSFSKIYPNPAKASQSVFINYTVKKTTTVSIGVYNMLGKKVATVLDNKRVKAGDYQEETTLNLEPGIYFYTLSIDNTVVYSKKFTVTH